MRLLILEILYGDESLISVFYLLYKVIVPVYFSVCLPLFLPKKNLSCNLRLIKFLILRTLRFLILSLQFFTCYLSLWLLIWVVLVLLLILMLVVSDDFNNFRSFLIFSSNLVANVDVHVNVNVGNYLNRTFYDHDFQSKPESNSKKFKPP